MTAREGDPKTAAVGLAILGTGIGTALLVGGALDVRMPDVHVAHGAKVALSWVAGLAIMAAGGFLLYLAVKQANGIYAVTSILALLFGFSMLGSTAGVPPAMQGLVSVLQGAVDAINAALSIIANLLRLFS